MIVKIIEHLYYEAEDRKIDHQMIVKMLLELTTKPFTFESVGFDTISSATKLHRQ